MGHRFKCKYYPKKYKTRSSRKNHKDKACPVGRSLTKAARRADDPAQESNKGRGYSEGGSPTK